MSHGAANPSGSTTDILLVVLGFALVAGLGYWGWSSADQTGESGGELLKFEPIRVDREKLRSEREEKYGELRDSLPEDATSEVVSLMEKLNAMQFPPPGDESNQSELAEKLSVRADNDVVPHTGSSGFVAAGEPLFERCDEGLESLLGAVRDGELPMDEARTNPPPEAYQQYRRACGPFLDTLRERKLVDETGTWSDPEPLSRAVAGILQRLRWATIVDAGRQALEQLTPYETRLLMRWRIESGAYPLEKRREYLDLVARNEGLLPGYDPTLARATLAYQDRDLEKALSTLKNAARRAPDGKESYRPKIESLRRELGARNVDN